MKTEQDSMKALFEKFENQWDIQELKDNHEDLFLEKLNAKKSKLKLWFPMGIAAAILISIGIYFGTLNNEKTSLQFASVETRETDSIFNVTINNQLLEIKEKTSPENKKIIDDAFLQMKTFDADYETIKKELQTNGESKQIIFAMISNLQTRLDFLQQVLENIENTEKLKNTRDENTI